MTYDLADDPDGGLFRAFGGLGMPTTVFISANGFVVGRHTGALTTGQLEQTDDQMQRVRIQQQLLDAQTPATDG